jgi:hypothetical protein
MSVSGYPDQCYDGFFTRQGVVDAWDLANGVGHNGPILATWPAPSMVTWYDHVLSNEEVYFAVVQGVKPGVYYRR